VVLAKAFDRREIEGQAGRRAESPKTWGYHRPGYH
jgi:hypothetical protein